MDHGSHNTGKRSFLTSRSGIAFMAFLAIAGFFLWTEHRAHIALAIPYLPILLLVACVFIHGFMHSGHGTDRN